MPSCGDSQCKQIASKLRRIEELNKQLADERDKADSKYRLLRTGHTINHRSCREKDCRAASEEPSRSPSMPVGPAPEMNRVSFLLEIEAHILHRFPCTKHWKGVVFQRICKLRDWPFTKCVTEGFGYFYA